ncbi:maleylpyruvate isomerase family mycothiol-dependent enzyme [Actinoplanes sp. TBRC 11911]|nr:maleylpyruvate isomerase family mycothiol-dependent enzyme [Actinoplanes sp. TBRC 11911]
MTRAVPTCPGWSLEDLIEHVGHLNRWAAQIIIQPDPALVAWDAVPDSAPSDYSAATLSDWLPGSQQAVVDAVQQVGPDTEVMTFIGIRPARWWMRRLLNDSLMHQADAAISLGSHFHLTPSLAADNIAEALELFVARAGATYPTFEGPLLFPTPLDEGKSLRLELTDLGLEGRAWSLVRNGDGVAFSGDHDFGATIVRGPALDLMLMIGRRVPVSQSHVEITGDPAVLDAWLDRTPY